MIFFEEDDRIEVEQPSSVARYVVTNVTAFAVLLSLTLAAVVLALVGLAHVTAQAPNASLGSWLNIL